MIARFSSEVYSTSGSKPVSASSSPARLPSATPLSVRLTSCQPVNWLEAFHSDSP
jgi:hypothetical protein